MEGSLSLGVRLNDLNRGVLTLSSRSTKLVPHKIRHAIHGRVIPILLISITGVEPDSRPRRVTGILMCENVSLFDASRFRRRTTALVINLLTQRATTYRTLITCILASAAAAAGYHSLTVLCLDRQRIRNAG
jgi:hypothetical protein